MGDVVFAPLLRGAERRGVRFEFFHRLENVAALRPSSALARASGRTSRRSSSTCRRRCAAGRVPAARRRARPAVLARRRPTTSSSSTASGCAHEGWDFESHWDTRRVGSADAARRHGLRFRRARRRSRRRPARLPRARRARPALARDGRPREDGRDAGLPALAERGHGGARLARGPRSTCRASSSPSTPGPTCATCSTRRAGRARRGRSPTSATCCRSPPNERARPPRLPRRQRERVRRNARGLPEPGRRPPLAAGATGRPASSAGSCSWLRPARGRRLRRGADEARFASQFWTANVNPSDRYALSLPGSQRVPHLAARRHLRQPDHRRRLDRLRLQRGLRRGGRHVGPARRARHLRPPALEDIVGFDHP